jgi:hypothetical protein
MKSALLSTLVGILFIGIEPADTVKITDEPAISTNWWGIILLVALTILATWLRRKLK